MLASKRPEGRENYRPHVCLVCSWWYFLAGVPVVAGFGARNQIKIPGENIPFQDMETPFEKRQILSRIGSVRISDLCSWILPCVRTRKLHVCCSTTRTTHTGKLCDTPHKVYTICTSKATAIATRKPFSPQPGRRGWIFVHDDDCRRRALIRPTTGSAILELRP